MELALVKGMDEKDLLSRIRQIPALISHQPE